MPLLSWQLWLATESLQDRPLPWQKLSTHLSPGRVANCFATVLARIGTPATIPKPRGNSPGWTPVDLASSVLVIRLSKKALPNPAKHLKSLLKTAHLLEHVTVRPSTSCRAISRLLLV